MHTAEQGVRLRSVSAPVPSRLPQTPINAVLQMAIISAELGFVVLPPDGVAILPPIARMAVNQLLALVPQMLEEVVTMELVDLLLGIKNAPAGNAAPLAATAVPQRIIVKIPVASISLVLATPITLLPGQAR